MSICLFLKIYKTTLAASATSLNSALFSQESSNHLTHSCGSQLLLFKKYVTMNLGVLSEWQFNFHYMHYGPLYALKCLPEHHHLWGCWCWWHFHLCQYISAWQGWRSVLKFIIPLTCLLIHACLFLKLGALKSSIFCCPDLQQHNNAFINKEDIFFFFMFVQ